MKNFAFGLIYLTQAVLTYHFPDYEYLGQKRMFTAMFALMFGAFSFI